MMSVKELRKYFEEDELRRRQRALVTGVYLPLDMDSEDVRVEDIKLEPLTPPSSPVKVNQQSSIDVGPQQFVPSAAISIPPRTSSPSRANITPAWMTYTSEREKQLDDIDSEFGMKPRCPRFRCAYCYDD